MIRYGLRPMTFENLLNDLWLDFPTDKGYKVDKKEDSYDLALPLPGFDKEDLEMSIEEGILTIAYKGEEERWKNPFTKHFSLPKDSDEEKVEATLEKGILSVRIPKREETRTKKISIL